MNYIPDADTLILLLGIFTFLSVLISWHFNKTMPFDLQTALVQDGRFSLSKLGQLVALAVSTWIIIYQTRNGLLTEWLFAGYMFAWAGANIASKWLGKDKAEKPV